MLAAAKHSPAPEEPPEEAPLAERLDQKLSELIAAGYQIQWIAAGIQELEQLFREAGDDIIRLDEDPSRDIAWLGDFEFRPAPTPGIFIYITGEYPELSCHVL